MSERKLAHIEKVVSLEPIEGADKIEKCTILGWQCVIKKGEVKVGDLICYVEIDSIVPNIPYFEFMYEPKMNRKGRVKTIKLKKQISQGLPIPLTAFPEIASQLLKAGIKSTYKFKDMWEEGHDVTDLLCLTKWESESEKESNYAGFSKKNHNWFIKFMTRFSWFRKMFKMRSKSFPNWISKTDEDRIQNRPDLMRKLEGVELIETEKLEGQSGTYWYIRRWPFNDFGICSRQVRKFEKDNSNWSRVARELDIKNKLKSVGKNIAIQGEVIGKDVEGNIYNLNNLDFYVFNVYDIDKKRKYNYFEKIKFCNDYGFKFVPVINEKFILPTTIDELVAHATDISKLYNTKREGIVIRTVDDEYSFKVVSPEYLLEHKK